VPIPGFYVWEVPGKPISIQLSLDVVDRLQQDVMRGFGALPRRGAEVGGILLGSSSIAGPASAGRVVRVEDYALVPIQYKRGPSYRLSDDELQAFQAAVRQSRSRVGYFRSHTRDGVGLSDEDLDLLSNCFPEPETIALLIRPFATKPSVAGFYFKEQGAFQNGAPSLEFPFRRGALAPGDTSTPVRTETPPAAPIEAAAARKRPRWPVLPIILLLIGVLLGYQAALSVRSPRSAYQLALTVGQSGSDLQLKWDRQSPAIRNAQKGTLTIEDGAYSGSSPLSAAELQSGSVTSYRPLTKHVHFRLDVFPNPRNTISETIDWISPANRITEQPHNR
jgi:hypothetical protein